MSTLRSVFILLMVISSQAAIPQRVSAKTIRVEYLAATITPRNLGLLFGLSCRNYDHVVHLNLSIDAIDWPSDAIEVESTGYKRLIFWNKAAEYLFPDGTYTYLHGSYVVDGYFIARSGGVHQGVISNAFEKIDDLSVLLNPAVEEVPVASSKCR